MSAFYTKSALIVCVGLVVCLPQVAQGATSIIVGTHLLQPNTPNQIIQIFVTGGDQIQGVNFRAQIGDDPEFGVGPVFQYGGGPGASTIIGPGTIFASNNVGMNDVTYFPALFEAGTATASGTVAAEGLLATLVIDTTGVFGGLWSLRLFNTLSGPTDWAGSVFNGSDVSNPIIVDGFIAEVPEPSSVALAAFGIAGLAIVGVRRRRIRSR
jgi:hypothetical protein